MTDKKIYSKETANKVKYEVKKCADNNDPHFEAVCKCSSVDHMVVFQLLVWGHGDSELYVNIQDYYPESFWGRLKWIWNVLLRRKGHHWGDCVITEKQLPDLVDFMIMAQNLIEDENKCEIEEIEVVDMAKELGT